MSGELAEIEDSTIFDRDIHVMVDVATTAQTRRDPVPLFAYGLAIFALANYRFSRSTR